MGIQSRYFFPDCDDDLQYLRKPDSQMYANCRKSMYCIDLTMPPPPIDLGIGMYSYLSKANIFLPNLFYKVLNIT